LILGAVCVRFLPESPRYAAARPVAEAGSEAPRSGNPLRILFSSVPVGTTLLLWSVYFSNLLIIYFLTSWLPAVLNSAGVPLERAIQATAALYVGGIGGAIVLGRLIDCYSPGPILSMAYAGAAALLTLIGYGGGMALLFTLILLTGFCIIGAQFSLNALATTLYPTAARSTGVGWALGIGRIGSLVGPVLGGVFLLNNFSVFVMFAVVGAFSLLAAVAASFLRRGASD
jgi:AAHS family 4-hydroxybenzoate transporter-like MFS transporter